MKIPEKIKFGGHNIPIKLVMADEIKGSGEYDSWYEAIKVNRDGTPEAKQAETLLHEIIEVINAKFNLEISHTALTGISEMLFSVLRNNDLDFSGKKEGISA